MKDKICKFMLAVGFALLAAAFAAPETAAAAETEMQFNQFRIKTSAIGDIVLWGENYTSAIEDFILWGESGWDPDDGSSSENGARSVPASITCHDTVYIQADMFIRFFQIMGTEPTEGTGWEATISANNDCILDDGRSVPLTVYHSDALYVQIDALCEIFDNTVLWNGDSNTITVLNFDPSGADGNVTLLDFAEMPDANGNMWRYSVVETTHEELMFPEYYMIVTDDARGFSRGYRLTDRNAYEFMEDRVYLIKYEKSWWHGYAEEVAKFCTILYENTPDNQDGTEYAVEIYGFRESYGSHAGSLINDRVGYYMTYANQRPSNHIHSFNFETGEGLTLWHGYSVGKLEKVEDGYLYFEASTGRSDLDMSVYGMPYKLQERAKFKVKIDGTEEAIILGLVE